MPLHKHVHYEVIPDILPENTVFIHGNLASGRWWYPAEQLWRKKAEQKKMPGSMILLDLPGCGRSLAPDSPAALDARVFAQDLIGTLKELGVGSTHLVGHSAGGLISALMLSQAPELFRRAILLDPVGPTGIVLPPLICETYEQMRWNKDLMALVIGSTIYNNDSRSDFFRQVVVEDAFQAVKTIGMGIIQALNGLDIREECSKIQHHVLVLHGEHDQLLPVQDSKTMSDLMKNSKFEILPGQGHCANVENPAAFVALVDSFAFCQ